jgi:hydantoinase/carbamoylase family amidase
MTAAAALDEPGLLQHLRDLAGSARTAQGGVTRLAWSPEDIAAGAMLTYRLGQSGVRTRTDAVRNLIAEWPGTQRALAPIVIGSHLDSVIEGGELDGAYGTLAAFEVVQALAQSGEHLRHPVRAVAWANEEGVVAAPFTGSRAASGQTIDIFALGPDGRTLAQRLVEVGGDPEHVERAAMGEIAGYLELHIEQGAVLDRTGSRIGVVTGIVGATRGRIRFDGQTNHAGTTPMNLRSDAVVAAAHCVLAIERIGRSELVDVATAGAIETYPGNANVVAGRSFVSFDMRSMDDTTRESALQQLRHETETIAATTRTSVSLEVEARTTASPMGPVMQGAIADSAAQLGLSHEEIASGAGHDAQCVAKIGPVGMIFVPSIGGVSHQRDERTEPADLIAGARVLLAALRSIDQRLDA